MTTPAKLLAKLQAKYPAHEFDFSTKDGVGCTDFEDAPDLLITFTSPEDHECIVDPLTDCSGFERVDDTLAYYGIDRADAEAIRAHNMVQMG